MTNNSDKIKKRHYEDFEDRFLFALSEVIKNNGLKVSYAAEIACGLLSNRTAKGIEQRLGAIIRNEIDPNKVAIVVNIDKDKPTDNSELPVAALTSPIKEEPKEKEINPMDVFAAIMNGDLSNVSNVVEEFTVSEREFDRITNPNNNIVIDGGFTPRRLPFFDESDLGRILVVVVNNVVDYGFFADNNEKTGLVRGKAVSQGFVPYELIPTLVKKGDTVTVEIVRDDFNNGRVVLQPFYDINGDMIKGDILDTVISKKDYMTSNVLRIEEESVLDKAQDQVENTESQIVYSTNEEDGFKNNIHIPTDAIFNQLEEASPTAKEETFQFLSYDISVVPNSNIDMLNHLITTESIIKQLNDFSSSFVTKGNKLFMEFSFESPISLDEKKDFDDIIKESINFCK